MQPHHLQWAQRCQHESLASARRLTFPYPHGLIESRISGDALENMLVRFDRLRAVMPSGVEVNVPEDADLPPLDIKREFEGSSKGFTIELGVPLWYASRGNTLDGGATGGGDWRDKRMFRIAEITRPDENTGENPQPMQVRRVNARLLLPGDDRTDLETIPVVRIAHGVAGGGSNVGKPQPDPEFIPPCMTLTGSSRLAGLVRDLSNQVEATRKELLVQINRGGFSIESMRGLQFEQMLRLRTLNRFSAVLPSLHTAPGVTPFEIYLVLRELLGELAALHPDRDQFECANYDHTMPGIAFKELDSKIRPLLGGSVAPSYMSLEFVPGSDPQAGAILTATFSEEQLTRPNEYYLGVKTKTDPRAVAQLVEDQDQFKLMAKSMVARNIFGVKLVEERHPPLELPAEGGLHYFRVNRTESERMWGRIKEEKEVAIRWPGVEGSDFKVKMYMTVPK